MLEVLRQKETVRRSDSNRPGKTPSGSEARAPTELHGRADNAPAPGDTTVNEPRRAEGESPSRSRPIQFHAPVEGTTGPRLGGRPPSNASPSRIGKHTRFFVALPDPERRSWLCSLFLHFSMDEVFDGARKLHCATDLIECVRRPAAPSRRRSELVSELSPCQVIVGRWRDDWDAKAGAERGGSKLWGAPCVFQPDSATASLPNLQRSGFIHFAQLTLDIGPRDYACRGTWPFGGGQLNVFTRTPHTAEDWCFYWWL